MGTTLVYRQEILWPDPLHKTTTEKSFSVHKTGCRSLTPCLSRQTYSFPPLSSRRSKYSRPIPAYPAKPGIFLSLRWHNCATTKRSEERRVGKECTARGWPYARKK